MPVTCLELSRFNAVSVLWQLTRALRRTSPQLVQTSLYHANLIGRVAARLAGVRTVVSGIRVAERRSRFRLVMDRWTDRFVTRHVCVSDAVATFSKTRGGLPLEKLTVIPNGVDAEHFRSAQAADLSGVGVPAGALTVLFVGRLEYQKGPDLLLRVAELLSRKLKHAHFVLVGAGAMESSLRDAAAVAGLDQHVHFVGRVPDVAGLMKAADCLVLPSRWEGMPNVVLEAMASGLPVAAAAVEGVSELLGQSERGLVVDVENPQALALAVERIAEDASFRAAATKSAQRLVSKQFTWDAVRDSYVRLYRELLAVG